MPGRATFPLIYMAALLTAAALLASLVPDGGAVAPLQAFPVANRPVPDLVGSWAGSWQDTVYMVSGDLSWEITQNASDLSGSGTIDLSVLGLGVRSGTAAGSLGGGGRANTLTFTFEAESVGNGSGTVVDATGSGTGTVTAPLSFGEFTFTGTLTDDEIEGTFDFTSPTGGAGRATLLKDTPVQAATWGSVKAGYREGAD